MSLRLGLGPPQTPNSVPFFLRQQPLGLFCGLSPGRVAVTSSRCPSHLHRHRGHFSRLVLHTSEISLRKFCLCLWFFFNVGYFLTSERLWVSRVGGEEPSVCPACAGPLQTTVLLFRPLMQDNYP